jgi:hypothetical protein
MNRGRVGEERGGKEMDGCPLTKPPINGCPCDSGVCRSVTQTCPNASEVHPMWLRYEQRRMREVDDIW